MPFKDAEQKQGYDRQRNASNKFTVVGEDPIHLHLRGPNGKVMRVAKQALSPTVTEQIRGYSGASGDPGAQVVASYPPGELFQPTPTDQPHGTTSQVPAPASDPGQPMLGELQASEHIPPEILDLGDDAIRVYRMQQAEAESASAPDREPVQGPIDLRSPGKKDYDRIQRRVEEATAPSPMELNPPYQGPIQMHPPGWKAPAVAAPTAEEPEVPDVPLNLPIKGSNPDRDQLALSNFMDGYSSSMKSGYPAPLGMPGMPRFPGLDQDGLPDAVAAERALGEAKARAQQDIQRIQAGLLEKQQALAAKRQAQEAARAKGAEARQADIENMRIEPEHFWDSRSNAQKASSIISLILGGMSTSFGGENPALKILDNAIARDLDAQKANLGKKQSSLSVYLAQTKDLREAETLVRADLLDDTATLLKMEAAKSNSEQEVIAASGKVAELHMKAADMRNGYGVAKFNGEMKKVELAAKTAADNAMLQVKMMEKNAAKVKDMHALKILMPEKRADGKPVYRFANSPEDKTQVQNSLVAFRSVNSKLTRLRQLYSVNKWGIWNPFSDKWQEADLLTSDLIKATASAMEPGGRMSDQDQKFYTAMNGSLLGFQKSPTAYGARLMAMTNTHKNNMAAQVEQRTQSAEEFLRGY